MPQFSAGAQRSPEISPPDGQAPCSIQGLEKRIEQQGERIHIPIGLSCNNNCLFCMEDNREKRKVLHQAFELADLKRVLEPEGLEEVCFTSGEPTTHPSLPAFISVARDSGIRRISLMTNGRRLSYAPYTRALLRAGLNRIYVSIHGPSAAVHDSLTRTPGSFQQAVDGLRVILSLRARGAPVEVHISTVLTSRNVHLQLLLYEAFCRLGAGQIVFNAVQVRGRALANVKRIVPRYTTVVNEFMKVIENNKDLGQRAFLVDVPMCLMEQVPDRSRGFMEKRTHYEATTQGELAAITTQALDLQRRIWLPSCSDCRHRRSCAGIDSAYARHFGTAEFSSLAR